MNAEIGEEARDIARPADGDCRCAERIFEDQIPADDPGDEFAHRRISISIGAAGDGNGRGHLGIAEAGEGADEPGQNVGKADRRPRIFGRGMSGENENTGADDAADTERDEAERPQGPFQRRRAEGPDPLHFDVFGFLRQDLDRLAGE